MLAKLLQGVSCKGEDGLQGLARTAVLCRWLIVCDNRVVCCCVASAVGFFAVGLFLSVLFPTATGLINVCASCMVNMQQ